MSLTPTGSSVVTEPVIPRLPLGEENTENRIEDQKAETVVLQHIPSETEEPSTGILGWFSNYLGKTSTPTSTEERENIEKAATEKIKRENSQDEDLLDTVVVESTPREEEEQEPIPQEVAKKNRCVTFCSNFSCSKVDYLKIASIIALIVASPIAIFAILTATGVFPAPLLGGVIGASVVAGVSGIFVISGIVVLFIKYTRSPKPHQE